MLRIRPSYGTAPVEPGLTPLSGLGDDIAEKLQPTQAQQSRESVVCGTKWRFLYMHVCMYIQVNVCIGLLVGCLNETQPQPQQQ